jgi:hypothetical protein
LKKTKRKTRAAVPPAIDRRVTDADKPINAETEDRRVADPYSRDGAHIVVTATLRDDPLSRLHKRHQIDAAQNAAGAFLQQMFELLGSATVKAMDFTKPPVDGSGHDVMPITEAQRRAASHIAFANRVLGTAGFQLTREVLAERKFIERIARERHLTTKTQIEYLGRRFRECLETLAGAFGFVVTGSGPRPARDAHSRNANHANSPELHRAIRAAQELPQTSAPHVVTSSVSTLKLPDTKGEAA